jgi:hypothetical protein
VLLGPLAGGADDDDDSERYASLDPNDEAAVRAVIRDRIKPEITLSLDGDGMAVCKESLAYFLAKDGFNFGELYDGLLMPFDHPRDPRCLFLWLWEELFGEAYRPPDTSDFSEGMGFCPVKYLKH